MSRNFELLYQMNKTQEILQTDSEPAVVPLVPVEVTTGAPTLELDGMAREEISKLVQRLFQMPDKGTRHVVFTSMESGDGCSWICSRVGEILAGQVAGSICLVDCSLRAPSLHRQFKVENHYGLADALSGDGPIRQYAQQLSRPNLWLLSGGATNDGSQVLLTSDRMRARIAELRAEFNYVLMDVASFNVCNHAMIFGGLSDGVVLVLKANSTRRDATREVMQQLEASKVRLLGAVLNQRTFPIPERIYNKL
ncbi:MAG TPA: CpsD/CapB family tyrosine-protein kinase [Terriglobales bacterium]|nr:CpsD/CapB family tyrosine-protein kinase [Terriglobales bacterium]